MAKRELSPLQKAYSEFFFDMLSAYEVETPAQLSDERKKEFFNQVKTDWAKKKRELAKQGIKPKSLTEEKYVIKEVVQENAIRALIRKELTLLNEAAITDKFINAMTPVTNSIAKARKQLMKDVEAWAKKNFENIKKDGIESYHVQFYSDDPLQPFWNGNKTGWKLNGNVYVNYDPQKIDDKEAKRIGFLLKKAFGGGFLNWSISAEKKTGGQPGQKAIVVSLDSDKNKIEI